MVPGGEGLNIWVSRHCSVVECLKMNEEKNKTS